MHIRTLLFMTSMLFTCSAGVTPGAAGLLAAQRSMSDAIVLPARAPSPARRNVIIPSLPAGTGTLRPISMTVISHERRPGQASLVSRRAVTRRDDRVHVRLPDGREWLYLRNPVDTRRVSALLIVPAARTIVTYEESDLRNWQGIRGWADVVTLGIDMDALSSLWSHTETKTAGGLRFTRLTARDSDGTGALREVWWNAEQALPHTFVTAQGNMETRVQIEHLTSRVDDAVLRLPQERFPDFTLVDLADWLER